MNEKEKKKMFRKTNVMSIIITIVFLIISVVGGYLEPQKYKIKVEVTYYGYLAHPKASVKLTGERAEPVSLKELLQSALEKEKNRAFLDIECKEQPQTFEIYKSVGIQPAVAGPFVNRNHEACRSFRKPEP
jgi:hypothetical protein